MSLQDRGAPDFLGGMSIAAAGYRSPETMEEALTPLWSPERLEAVRRTGLLDTPPEEAFDRLARVAARTVGAPIAFITLVDDRRQFFKASVGLPEPWSTWRETPLTHSFCRHVVEAGAPLIVENAREHPLVRNNLAIPELGIIAYLGVPLKLETGMVLGTLSVIDTVPRRWTDEEIRIVKDLAGFALTEIALRMELQEHRRADELAKENRRKDDFLAVLSHELRNPLAAIGNAIYLMRLETDPEVEHRTQEIIDRQVRHLTALVNDLLDMARVRRGEIELQQRPVELGMVIRDALLTVQAMVEARRQQVHLVIPEETLCLEADPVRLEQVLNNLLHNAVKFTPEGGHIWLWAAQHDSELVIRIRDTGRGIPADRLSHIWEPFSQVDASLDRAEGGLGLGLTLVRTLVELHGGRVEATSGGLGKGSEFIVRLPAVDPGVCEMRRRPTLPASPDAPLQILVVEDNADAAETLEEILTLWGHSVRVVHTGRTALEAVRGLTPDLVLLDIGLPEMDGFEVARHLRCDPALKDTWLVAVTGYGHEEDRRRGREAGFDEHLVKPVQPDELQRVLEQARGSRPAA